MKLQNLGFAYTVRPGDTAEAIAEGLGASGQDAYAYALGIIANNSIVDSATGDPLGPYDDLSALAGDSLQIPDAWRNIGATGSSSSNGVLDQAAQLLPQIAAFITAEQLAQINIDRAKKGLQPLNTAAYGPQVGVSLSPQTQQYITIGLVVLALLMFMSKKRGS